MPELAVVRIIIGVVVAKVVGVRVGLRTPGVSGQGGDARARPLENELSRACRMRLKTIGIGRRRSPSSFAPATHLFELIDEGVLRVEEASVPKVHLHRLVVRRSIGRRSTHGQDED